MAALPASLCASYITYKHDTNQVVSWLAETGLKCGYNIRTQDKTPQTRLKSKRPINNENQSGKLAKNTIPTYLFIPLAEHIAQTRRKAIELPRSVSLSLDRAIQVRKEHNKYHKIQHPSSQVVANDGVEGHVHFVNILEKVRSVLKHLYPNNSVGVLSTPATSDEVVNRFAHLKVEQPVAGFDATIPDVPAFVKDTQAVDIKFEAEVIDDYEEAFLAACCLIDDLNEVRQFLRRTWKAYLWQNTDLGSVSVATDNAIAMARQNIDDFSERFMNHNDLTTFVEAVFANQCRAESLNGELRELDPPFDFAVSRSADTSFLWIKSLWASFIKTQASDGKTKATAKYRPSPSWQRAASMPAQERYVESKDFLLTFLPDYCCLASKLAKLQELMSTYDSITLGFWEFSQNDDSIPFWLLFALQVFLDIRQELGHHTHRGFEDLVYHSKTVSIEIDLQRKLEELYSIQGIPNWPDGYLKSLHTVTSCTTRLISQDVITFVLETPSPSLKDMSSISRSNPDDKNAYCFLRHHPLLCGLLMFRNECSMLKLGLELANTTPLIMSSAHLYNALSKTGYLDEEWPDMEALIHQQDEKHLFFGGRPLTILDCTKKLDLITGVSVMEYARNTRATKTYKPKLNNKNRRQLGTSSMPVTQVLSDLYRCEELQILNSALVLKALGATGKDRGFDGKTRPVDWLKLLLHQVHDEAPKRKFSYFALDRKCREVLSILPDVVRQEKPSWLRDMNEFFSMSGPLVDPTALPAVVFRVISSSVPIDRSKAKCPCCGKSKMDRSEIEEHSLEQQRALRAITRAIREELVADDEDVGVTSSAHTTKMLADCLQRGGSPDMRVQLKTTLLTHTSSDEALVDIDAFYNNRGGDFVLKQRKAGARYDRHQAVAGLSYPTAGLMKASTTQSSVAVFEHMPQSLVDAQGSSRSPPKPKTKLIATPAKPKTLAEFLKSLPPLKEPLAKVDMKAMCRELMEDGVLDALEQAMLMNTGK